jgi:hypothetical protein
MVRTSTPDVEAEADAEASEGVARYGGDSNDVDQDPVRSLHDIEEEAGDEVGITDTYSLDVEEAEQMGVALDPVGGREAELD